MTSRTLIDGRIPQAWDLAHLRDCLAFAERLARAPDPLHAQSYRERADMLARAIQETEHVQA